MGKNVCILDRDARGRSKRLDGSAKYLPVSDWSRETLREALARIEIGDVWNCGRRDVLGSIFSDSCVLRLDGDDDVYGRAPYWKSVQRYRDAFPDR